MVMAMAMTGQFFILAALTPNQPAPYKIPALTIYGFLFKCHLTVEVHNATCFLYKSAKLMILILHLWKGLTWSLEYLQLLFKL